jgi:hypothetical protein
LAEKSGFLGFPPSVATKRVRGTTRVSLRKAALLEEDGRPGELGGKPGAEVLLAVVEAELQGVVGRRRDVEGAEVVGVLRGEAGAEGIADAMDVGHLIVGARVAAFEHPAARDLGAGDRRLGLPVAEVGLLEDDLGGEPAGGGDQPEEDHEHLPEIWNRRSGHLELALQRVRAPGAGSVPSRLPG